MTNQITPWDAMGDPTRRAIFEKIVHHPRAVAEIAKGLPVSRPAVSQHLRVLESAGLVVHRNEGTRNIYAVHAAGLVKLRADLDRFWTQALHAFKHAAEAAAKKEKEQS
jgi:DNA-binding transcriptional ArsR family regulator